MSRFAHRTPCGGGCSLLSRRKAAATQWLAVALTFFALPAGCSTRSAVMFNYPHAQGETLTQSSEEHFQSVRRSAEQDRRALVEDLDMLFLTDRPTRLTRWHER